MTRSVNSIFLVGLLSAFSFLTFDLYQSSIPYLVDYFSTNYSLVQLTLTLYLFFFGAMQLVWGPLIDHYGRRKLLPGCLLLAVFASLLCVFAQNIWILIIGRSLQGVALCCANLVALSTARDFDDPLQRAKVLSYVSMIVAVSPIFAPILGAFIFTYCGWQANFLIMAIIGLWLYVQSKNGLREAPNWTLAQDSLNFSHIMRSYREILSTPTVWSGALIMMFTFAAVMLSIINSSYLIIDELGYSQLGYGLIFIVNGLNIIFGNYLGIWLRRWLSMEFTIYMGAAFILGGGLVMFTMNMIYGFSLLAFAFSLVANLGISLAAPATMSLTLSNYEKNTGLVLAVIHTIRMFGSAVLVTLCAQYLTTNLNALPIGLFCCGLGTFISAYQFAHRRKSNPDDDNLIELKAAG